MRMDLSVYLVTASELVPEGKTLVEIVQKAVEAGATIVQLREKSMDTKSFVELATDILKVTKKVIDSY
jgi:thiamine-phosphate diphosphorylase/hydroxyethylthiazole kinase